MTEKNISAVIKELTTATICLSYGVNRLKHFLRREDKCALDKHCKKTDDSPVSSSWEGNFREFVLYFQCLRQKIILNSQNNHRRSSDSDLTHAAWLTLSLG